MAGQAGSGRAHSRCQQARNASFQGQVRLIFSTRARAWRTRRAGRLRSREQLARFLVVQREDGQIPRGTGGDPDGVLVEVSEALSAAGRPRT